MGKEIHTGCLAKQVAMVGKWGSIPLGPSGDSIEHDSLSSFFFPARGGSGSLPLSQPGAAPGDTKSSCGLHNTEKVPEWEQRGPG